MAYIQGCKSIKRQRIGLHDKPRIFSDFHWKVNSKILQDPFLQFKKSSGRPLKAWFKCYHILNIFSEHLFTRDLEDPTEKKKIKFFKPVFQFAAMNSMLNTGERRRKKDTFFNILINNNNKLQWRTLEWHLFHHKQWHREWTQKRQICSPGV